MNKLAERREYGCACWNGNQDHTTNKRYIELLDRLAEYEDTGLTPEEIWIIAKEVEAYRELGTVEELEDALYDLSF
jgi:hypothetical protein